MPTRHKGPARETRALDTFIKLTRATQTLEAELQKSLAGSGLTEGQFGVLESLHHLGDLNQSGIGKKLLCSNANVCTLLDNLEKAGHVKRERSSEDRRVVNVSLTAQGRRLIERIFPAHAARITELMAGLPQGEQEQLGALCKKLGVSISRRSSEVV